MESDRLQGVVYTWKSVGAYGFIAVPKVPSGVFVHYLDVEGRRELNPGDRVTFQLWQDKDGRQKAIAVRLEAGA